MTNNDYNNKHIVKKLQKIKKGELVILHQLGTTTKTKSYHVEKKCNFSLKILVTAKLEYEQTQSLL